MNDLQKVEFNILKTFLEICDKLDLKYYLVCGSALGAVKYGGFIPWDDDIDVALPRADYEKFLSEAHKYLPEYYFVQNYRTDPEFHLIGTKIRDSRTTYIERYCEKLKINHGVFIDVFPLDGKWETEEEGRAFLRAQKQYEARKRVRLNYRRISRGNLFNFQANWCYVLYRLLGKYSNTAKYAAEYEEIIKKYKTEGNKIWCNHANSISPLEYSPAEQYGEGTWASFEGLKVRVPERYDEYLTQKYGKWREDLPEDQKQGHHHYFACDLDNPYTKYI